MFHSGIIERHGYSVKVIWEEIRVGVQRHHGGGLCRGRWTDSSSGFVAWPVMLQWLGRVAVHGRAALVNDKTALAADAARLRDANCVHGAQLLLELQAAAHQSSRAFDGSLVYLPEPLPRARLALAVFAQAWLAAGP